MISIIVPFWNVDKYIDNTLKSILKQTYTDYEVILIDDGSTDNSGKICDEYASEDSRFKVFHCEHKGVSVGRNKGLAEASGKYIFFLDGDDIIPPDCLEHMYNLIDKNKADMVQGNFSYVNDDLSVIPQRTPSPICDRIISGMDILWELPKNTGFYYVMSCNKLMKKELFDGFSYPEGKIHEDHFAIHEIAYKCNKAVCTEKITYLYVKHPGSITTKKFSIVNLTREEALYERCKFLKEHNLDDLATETALVALKAAPRIIQKCCAEKIYSEKVEKELNKYFSYEYGLCKNTDFTLKQLPFKLLIKILAEKPGLYAHYLKIKFLVMKPPK